MQIRRSLLLGFALAGDVVAAELPVELEPIQVTSSRREETVFDVPQPVTVLNGNQLGEQSPQVMAELLRYQAGAFFQQTGPGQGMIIVRGLKGAEVLHLVDGMRLNNAFFRTAPSQYIALIDPYNLAQIELLRGPYAALYGSDALGGVVQILTPESHFGSDEWAFDGRVRAQYGTADLSRVARAEMATGRQGLSFSLGYTFMQYGERLLAEPGQSPDGAGGFRLEDRVNDTDYLGRGVDFKTIWSPAAAHEWTASVQHFELPALPRYNETVPGYGDEADAAQSVYDNDRRFYHLRYRYSAAMGFVDGVELHLGRQVINDDRFDRTTNSSCDTFEFNRSTLTGLTAALQTALAGGHALQYGAEFYRDEVDSRSIRETPPDSGNTVSNGPDTFASRFPDGARADSFGAYILDQWTATDDWRFDVGTRWSRSHIVLPRADRAFGATLDDDDFTGNLGLRYAISPGWAWTANIGRGFRSPNINDLSQVGRRSNGRIVVANYDLRPESVTSVDTGIKFADDRWSGELTLFYSRYDDRITLIADAVPEGTGDCADDGDDAAEPCAQNQNIAKATYYGAESSLRVNLTEQWSARATLNSTYGQQQNQGTRTPGNRVPPVNGQIAVEYRPTPVWAIEPYFYYADQQDRLDPSDLNDHRINPNGTGGYGVLNLRGRWAPDAPYRMQLDFKNLLDKDYREHGSGIDGAGFGVVATVEARF
jgi:outer membrane receptor protein involved in Fe transport